MILSVAASNLFEIASDVSSFKDTQVKRVMKFTNAAATWLAAAVFSTAAAAQASPGYHRCVARVIQSEELPFAPIGSWLVRVILEITPPNGTVYLATFQYYMPWQGPPPRRGQAFRLPCDPSNPADLHLIAPRGMPTVF